MIFRTPLYYNCELESLPLPITLTCTIPLKYCLLTCEKHLHDRIISLKGEVRSYKTSLTPRLFIEVPVPSQESKRSCICVLVVSSLSLSTILIFGFRTVSTVWYVLELFRQCGMF
jgi:hypothetical protein